MSKSHVTFRAGGSGFFRRGEGTSGKRRHRNNLPRRIVFRNP